MKSIRVGPLAVCWEWYPVWVGWSVQRWSYGVRSSWAHGSAYLGRLKIVW